MAKNLSWYEINKISRNEPLISMLFKTMLDMDEEDYNITINCCGDYDIYFNRNGMDLKIIVDDISGMIIVKHRNTVKNFKGGHKYHCHKKHNRGFSSWRKAFDYIKTLHDPKDMNKKKSRIEKKIEMLAGR